MKTLILSCNTGQGHNSCAQAIKEYYSQQGEDCVMEDALRFISKPFSDFMAWGHVTMYRRFPWLFQLGYHYSERHPALFREGSGIYKLLTLGAERLHQYIQAEGFDAVICSHVFSAIMVTDMLKKHPIPIATSLVATDYTCHPGVKDCGLDLYFIAAPSLIGDYACAAITENQIRSVGIPIRQAFYSHLDQKAAKRKFGVPDSHVHLLIMCGSMGCGPIRKLAGKLTKQANQDTDISIICGTNRRLEKKLRRKYAKAPNVHIWGYVQDIPQIMDSADLYLTKPGGISVTEAAVKNLPMVLIDAVAGCEEYNRLFYIRNGGAKTAANIRELVCLTVDLLNQKKTVCRMRKRLEELPKGNAAEMIYEQMKELLEKKTDEKCAACR